MSTDGENPERVIIDHPERQNLLGLLIQNILATNLADEVKRSRILATKADIQVQAGEMIVTLRLDEGNITIIEGPSDQPKASVRGDMTALLGVASGGAIVGPFLRGAIHVSGNPLLLLKILPLIRKAADETASPQTTENGE